MAQRDTVAFLLLGAGVAAIGLLALGVTGAAAATTVTRRRREPEPVPAPEPAAGPPTGWSVAAQRVIDRMTPEQHTFMDRLRTALPSYIPLMVNSSRRTPEEQAEAMRAKLRSGDTLDGLRVLYGNRAPINEVLAVPQSQWGAIIQAQVDRDVFLSPHLRGDGLDISARPTGEYLPRAWLETIASAAKTVGARNAFVEEAPLHVHIQRIGEPAVPVSGSSFIYVGNLRVGGRGHYTPTYSTSISPRAGADAPKSILKRTVWRYIDFMKLYRGMSPSEYAEAYTVLSGADSDQIDQTIIDFQDEVKKEARKRNIKEKDVVVEFESKASQARLPSATGVPPAGVRVGGGRVGTVGRVGTAGRG